MFHVDVATLLHCDEWRIVLSLTFLHFVKGGKVSTQRLDVAVNRMADKFKGGELWIGNWESREDLKVSEIQYSQLGLTASS